jgi:predicted house-cleaning noncanonical NTP pyrophosphatase (MazG superfamily)
MEICNGLCEPCHIMWFVGCEYEDGTAFNLPWYWTKSHERKPNPDRLPPAAVRVFDKSQLPNLDDELSELQHSAIELCPTDIDLMRDKGFLKEVADISKRKNAPVILAGSTLAHAYYLLQSEGCSVIAKGTRTHTRVRNTAPMGKLVRDRIPDRISASQEHGITKRMPSAQVQRFLISKLVEEALEYREASGAENRLEELADAFEIIRALVQASGQTVEALISVANKKRSKAGGFEDGLVLIETSIGERRDRSPAASVMAQRVSPDTIEIPFACFGFMELDRPITLLLEEYLLWCQITLRKDRLVVSLLPEGQQMELDLYSD